METVFKALYQCATFARLYFENFQPLIFCHLRFAMLRIFFRRLQRGGTCSEVSRRRRIKFLLSTASEVFLRCEIPNFKIARSAAG